MIKAIIFDWGRTLYDSEAGTLFPDIHALLSALSRRYTLAIVSLVTGDYAARVAERREILRRADLDRFFSLLLFVPTNKDAAYAEALAALDIQAGEVAIVDDRARRGIAWGNRHGATTIWLRRGRFADELPDAEAGEPDHTVAEIGELGPLLLLHPPQRPRQRVS